MQSWPACGSAGTASMTDARKCDWATAVPLGKWHAFPRVPGPSFELEDRAACGAGPARHPYSSLRLAPACARCGRLTEQTGSGLVTVLRPAA